MSQATLVNNKGERVAVEAGSQDAQSYFGKGYTLMTPANNPAAPKTGNAPAPVTPSVNPSSSTVPAPGSNTGGSGAAPTDWTKVAASNPDIAKWYSGLPESKTNPDVVSFMKQQKEAGIYDYQKAIENGITPKVVSYDSLMHWDDSGKLQNNPNLNNQQDAVTAEAKKNQDIANLVSSGKEFTEEDAKNFAFANGESDYQKYIGGVAGKSNPNYIGATNWQKLQKTYTPYQLNQAIVRTNNGIYWNPNVNIAEIPSVDPKVQINADAKKVADVVSGAKKDSASLTTDGAGTTEDKTTPDLTGDLNKDKTVIMDELSKTYGDTAESVYNSLYNTEEMKTAQSDVTKLKSKLDNFDQQIDELRSDIQKEVDGEASDSYITALATVRGDKILKMKRSTQRDYDTALANYNGLKENASNLLQVKTTDNNNRYNRLFSTLQMEIQNKGTEFNQELALQQLSLQIPEGRSMTVNGTTIKGLKENDNINVVQFTEANGNTYVLGVDKKTGKEAYRTFIGKAKVTGGTETSPVTELNNYNATETLKQEKDLAEKLKKGDIGLSYDDKGNSFYYDVNAYNKGVEASKNDWIPFNTMGDTGADKIKYRL